LPRLLNIRTDLSEYRTAQYGYDRRGAGPRNTNASGQPYEIIPLRQRNFNESDFGATTQNTGGQVEDFLLRGGSLLPETAFRDVSRLTKMFTDLKSPNGILFTAKQEALSRSSVNILAAGEKEGFPTRGKNNLPFNNGVYLPTSTLLQAAGVGIGTHLLKQGIDPTADTDGAGGLFNLLGFDDPLAMPLYVNTLASRERQENSATSRLVEFAQFNINTSDNDSGILYSYSGGPGSVLGVTGKTNINMPSEGRTGRNNPSLTTSGFFNTGQTKDTNFGFNYSVFGKKVFTTGSADLVKDGTPFNFRGGTYFGDPKNDNLSKIKSVSRYYELIVSGSNLFEMSNNGQVKVTNDNINNSLIANVGESVYQAGTFTPNPSVPDQPGLTYNELMGAGSNSGAGASGGKIIDFRKNSSGVFNPDYSNRDLTLAGRANLGDPGRDNKQAKTSFNFSDRQFTTFDSALDKVNAYPIYSTNSPSGIGLVQNATYAGKQKDLCKFRIGVINNNDPSFTTYLHFRAFIDGMSDNFSSKWNETTYMGRAESFWNYSGFSREFSLDWTVAAQSKAELTIMYKKLNYLASINAPDYSENGYMRGNLIKLTIGDYLYEQTGFMSGISFSPPQESPWEISREDVDLSVKQLPFIMKVTGFKFTPIHDFVPQIQKNTFGPLFDGVNQESGDAQAAGTENGTPIEESILTGYGPQRYIALGDNIKGGRYNSYDLKYPKKQRAISTVTGEKIKIVGGDPPGADLINTNIAPRISSTKIASLTNQKAVNDANVVINEINSIGR